MEINGKNKQELKAIFRAKVAGGKHASRETLLSYAFVRGVPYKVLERVINEDKFPNGGTNSFISCLASSVTYKLIESAYGKSYFDMKADIREKYNSDYFSEGYEEESSKWYESYQELTTSVLNWMMVKYAQKSTQEESAA